MMSDYNKEENIAEIIKPYHLSLEKFEEFKKLKGFKEFNDELESIKEHPSLDGIYPMGAYEFSYALAESLSNTSLPFLAFWQKDVLKESIKTKINNDTYSWTNRFESLGATKEDTLKYAWKKATGILRICTVYQEEFQPDQPEGERINVDFPELLPYMNKSLKKIKVCDISCSKSETIPAIISKKINLKFPQKINLSINTSYILLSDKTDIFDVFNELVIKKKEDKERKLFFWVVLDSIDNHHQLDTTFAYQTLCGEKWNTQPKKLKINGLFQNSTIGLEGAVIVRKMQSTISNCLQFDNDDSLWGGSGWFVWLLTIFQRLVCTKLADDTSGIGDLIKKEPDSLNMKSRIDDLIKKEPDSLDIKSKIKDYRDEIIELETQWMYQEVAYSTDIDYLYGELQATFNIEKMWGNVREQTELIVQHAEYMQTRYIQKVQTIGGIIVSAILITFAFFGSNLFDMNGFTPIRNFVIYEGVITLQSIIVIFAVGLMVPVLNWFLKQDSGEGLIKHIEHLWKKIEWAVFFQIGIALYVIIFTFITL